MRRNFDSLPKWAREEMVRLRESNDALRDQLDAKVIGDHLPPENLHLESEHLKYGLDFKPSRFRGGRFTFSDDGRKWVEFRRTERGVEVRTAERLVIEPQSGNVATVRNEKF